MSVSTETEKLRALQAVEAESAILHAMRASALEMDVHRRAEQVRIIRSSTSWRITLPLRAAVYLLTRGPRAAWRMSRRATGAMAERGLRGAADQFVQRLRRRAKGLVAGPRPKSGAGKETYARRLPSPAPSVVAPRVLIVAELTLPQCAKYRVWQKQAHFALLGTECTVCDWRNAEACRSALQVQALVIFYRVPGFPEVLALIEEAKRLQVTSYWEADDLIFDIDRYRENRNLDTLAPALKAEVLAGVPLFHRAMLASDRTIASTDSLAAAMQTLGAGPTTVIENALDDETLEAAARLRARVRPDREALVIAYGSGSKAHDVDFAMAAPAIAEVLRARPHVRLLIIGELQLPAVLDGVADRIDRWPATGYVAYLGVLADADISLAPLEDTVFNDAKSNIKYLEAAILGVPSVCSPRAAFRGVVTPGEDGLLAEGTTEWRDALVLLIDAPEVRHRMGQAALQGVLARYAPGRIAERQVAPLVAGLDTRREAPLRVLAVNVFFAPISFGGATIVAEEMARRLQARPDTEVAVFTSREDGSQYSLTRYAHGDGDAAIPVIAATVPAHNVIAEFDNPEMAAVFADVLRAVQPDVVHFHSVQMLSASLLRTCQKAGIPYVVTVHDAWWLCARQFMVREDNNYCFQTRIDLNICEACIPEAKHLRPRLQILLQGLQEAALVLSPSEAHRGLYLANGLPPERVRVHRNGIRMPARPRRRTARTGLRFGYVGGTSGLKGYHLVRAVFETPLEGDYSLALVDNTMKLGFKSMDVTEWKSTQAVEIVPAFDQDSLDAFFDGLDVLLFPSQWKESFGLIVCEALARDVWVIVTEGGGAAEFVVDGENGTTIPLVNDPGPLRAAVQALLADPARLMTHVNPHKNLLITYDTQAEELHGLLSDVAHVPR